MLFDQPVQVDVPNYTRTSSLAHFVGFSWGGVGAVGSRVLRYGIANSDKVTDGLGGDDEQASYVCGGCGEEYDADRRFCRSCGSGAIHRK